MRRDVLRSTRGRRGFTMVEVVIASALLGFSLIVMFGFHSQAVRSNMNARRLTDCTYLAQTQMERLLAMDWTSAVQPDELSNGGADAGAVGIFDDLEWPGTGTRVNVLSSSAGTDLAPAIYTVTWDVQDMDSDDGDPATLPTWVRLRVRCTYEDKFLSGIYAPNAHLNGTTISTFRFRDS